MYIDTLSSLAGQLWRGEDLPIRLHLLQDCPGVRNLRSQLVHGGLRSTQQAFLFESKSFARELAADVSSGSWLHPS